MYLYIVIFVHCIIVIIIMLTMHCLMHCTVYTGSPFSFRGNIKVNYAEIEVGSRKECSSFMSQQPWQEKREAWECGYSCVYSCGPTLYRAQGTTRIKLSP